MKRATDTFLRTNSSSAGTLLKNSESKLTRPNAMHEERLHQEAGEAVE